MRILAIDPGYGRIGFAVAEKQEGKINVCFSECYETNKKEEYEGRVKEIGDRLREIMKKYKPEEIVLEKLFFAKNKKTALRVAEIRGMCIHESQQNGLEVTEYTPNQIKNAVTGDSRAGKEQIKRMVGLLVKLEKKEKRMDDEYDAIAATITHFANLQGQKRKVS